MTVRFYVNKRGIWHEVSLEEFKAESDRANRRFTLTLLIALLILIFVTVAIWMPAQTAPLIRAFL